MKEVAKYGCVSEVYTIQYKGQRYKEKLGMYGVREQKVI